jgi:hypothetical protein
MTDRFLHEHTAAPRSRMTAPAWMTAAEAAAFERGTTAADAAADAAGAGVVHHTPAQPTFDPTYRPQVRTSTPSEPYHPPKRNPLDPWWDRFAGLACTCPPGCTDRTWGDGGTCARNCVPRREMKGTPYTPKPKSPKGTNTTSTMDDAA